MRFLAAASPFIGATLAARPFLEVADTGFVDYLTDTAEWTEGRLPDLQDIRALPDFEFAAKQVLPEASWAFYRLAAGQEWGYRNNLDVWKKVQIRPRFLRDVVDLQNNIGIELFGNNFSAPFFIAPAANAAHGDPERAELNFMEASGDEDILYTAALYASKTIEELDAVKRNDTLNGRQVIFQQIYTVNDLSITWNDVKRAEDTGAKAIVLTVDTPGSSVRVRGARHSGLEYPSASTRPNTWEIYDELRARTNLPIILKGIQTVEDATEAVERGVDGIYLSNHGGRQLEFSPSPIEIAYEIYRNAPQIFQQVPVLADSGVRTGSDVLKLLALGVKAVGLGRPFMYANVYGYEGVRRAIRLLKNEIVQDGWNLGIGSLDDLSPSFLNLRALDQNVHKVGCNNS
ncbi:FMN-dependent alpha-hydroxy acid dehydrogenase [Sodiomyces alkalinus F11]|uniref:FMN-dependent alpha-hydroxy acid dehydrogenase n=1 Tax=Sodiomyces alkalinus (strain CBS 110278 / VKM F-3762 / F11) TaxID=1314773 RepID=A0A3N2PUI8_SODAK|nr:FMN-dependent alpha-hydroxy acid dehydrogenase [Sodiomyces alkalinus F11]ROT37996.1 FMN-dependent alpha-hydroxy acid dehydrogenase [Sodiomyces alkalinus F11]